MTPEDEHEAKLLTILRESDDVRIKFLLRLLDAANTDNAALNSQIDSLYQGRSHLLNEVETLQKRVEELEGISDLLQEALDSAFKDQEFRLQALAAHLEQYSDEKSNGIALQVVKEWMHDYVEGRVKCTLVDGDALFE